MRTTRPDRPTLTSPRVLMTIVLGIVLALLIVPFGGIYTVPALLIVFALVVLDLWMQLSPQTHGESLYARLQRQPLPFRLLAAVGVLALLVAVAMLLRVLGVLRG